MFPRLRPYKQIYYIKILDILTGEDDVFLCFELLSYGYFWLPKIQFLCKNIFLLCLVSKNELE